MIIHGDCLERLKELPDNSVDSICTDPPYFLTNSSGSGFMGKEWDSLSVANAFAEIVLRSAKLGFASGEADSAQDDASTRIKRLPKRRHLNVRTVDLSSCGRNLKLNPPTSFALENVITRDEAKVLSSVLWPSLTTVIEKLPANALFVAETSLTKNQLRNIALESALRLRTETLCEEIETLLSLMGDQKKSGVTEGTNGNSSESKFIVETVLSAENVASAVLEEKYNVTTLSLIDSQKIIHSAISSRSVRDAMAMFTENPSNIQILSELFHEKWAKEVFRVLKPGGHLLAFAGTRTYHPLAKAIESAGFQVRDMCSWLYGSGFPKSLDVSKAIDKAAGAEREVVGTKLGRPGMSKDGSNQSFDGSPNTYGSGGILSTDITAPATAAAKQWQGWGTALKPALEPICLARKPLEKGLTVAENVLRWGTGALNIDASRIEGKPRTTHSSGNVRTQDNLNGRFNGGMPLGEYPAANARWPANVILDEEAAKVLDEQSGTLKFSYATNEGKASSIYGGELKSERNVINKFRQGDSGGASRFFYVAKASKRERNAGLEGMPAKEKRSAGGTTSSGKPTMEGRDRFGCQTQNHHPTVKPVRLMEYLIRMITPPLGVVLDPFTGSGTTGVAAKRLGFGFIGIERELEYVEIARKRMEAVG